MSHFLAVRFLPFAMRRYNRLLFSVGSVILMLIIIRIRMNRHEASEFVFDLFFDLSDDIVGPLRASSIRSERRQGDHPVPRTVVVNHQMMDPVSRRNGVHKIADIHFHYGIRRVAENPD